MPEPILNPDYWKERLRGAIRVGQLHQAIFRTSLGQWEKIEAKHREILARLIQPEDTILDAACGWGRLLDLLPSTWRGEYCGVDISPEFIELAWEKQKERYANECEHLNDRCKPHTFTFCVADLRDLQPTWRITGPVGKGSDQRTIKCPDCRREREPGTRTLHGGKFDGSVVVCETCNGTGTDKSPINYLPEKWSVSVLISVRPMIKRNLGDEVWAQMETELRKCCERLLFLEYDPEDNGSIE